MSGHVGTKMGRVKGSCSRSRSNSERELVDAAGKQARKRKRTPSASPSRSRSVSQERVSRSRSKHRRQSRSRSRSYRRKCRSRSRSRSYDRYDDRRRVSRSPMSRRKRHTGDRERPKVSKCLGVFGLSLYTQEQDLRQVFEKYGPIDDMQIVYDHQTGKSRGFAFIYMHSIQDAIEAKDLAPGTEVDGRPIRVDFSITRRAHTPTPGVYLGKPTVGRSGYRSDRGRSPHGNQKRYSKSRSRSRSHSHYRY